MMKKGCSISHLEQFPSFLVLCISFSLLVMLVKYWSKLIPSTGKSPPGPQKFPIIGNLHQLIIGSSLPHQALADLAKTYGPVMHLQLGEHFAIAMSSSEAAKEVLTMKELNFAQRPIVLAVELMNADNSGLAFAPYGDYWKQVRKVCTMELLSMKRVESFKSIREEEAWNLIEFISSHEGLDINLSEKIFSMTNNITSRAAFGKKCKDQGEFMLVLEEAVEVVAGFNMADFFPSLKFLRYITGLQPKLKKLQKKIGKILDVIVNEHKAKSKSTGCLNDASCHEDVLDVFLRLQDHSNELDVQLTTNHIKAVTLDIFIGGTETSATTLDWVMSELIKNPKAMQKAQVELRQAFKGKTKIEEEDVQNLNYLKSVIKETLRMHPAVPLLPKESSRKCEINGHEIPAKAKVLINAWAIGRDPAVWAEPDCFKPERFEGLAVDFRRPNFEFIPFGAGRRMCPGISFANASMELALAQMPYHFNWKCSNGVETEGLDMNETFGATLRRKHNLHLIATTNVPFRK